MKSIRFVLWIMVAASAVTMVYLFQTQNSAVTNGNTAKLGGAFELVRHDGKPISDKDLLGKPHALFFGFTNCPEVCPTSLYEISTWLEALKEDGDKISVYFMSVDPERDTTQLLSQYLSAFDPRIVGITGERSKVEAALRSFKVYFKRVATEDGDYTMDHTASIYLMDSDGKFVRSIAYGEDGDSALAKLKRMLN